MKRPQISVNLLRYRLAQECDMECSDGKTYTGVFIPYKPNCIRFGADEGYSGWTRLYPIKERNPKRTQTGITHFLAMGITKEQHEWLIDNGFLSPSDKIWSPGGLGYISIFDSERKKKE